MVVKLVVIFFVKIVVNIVEIASPNEAFVSIFDTFLG